MTERSRPLREERAAEVAKPDEAWSRGAAQSEKAKWAWDKVSSVKGTEADKRYGTLARKLPFMLRRHGLGQTAAFLHARRDKPGDRELLQHLGKRVGAFTESLKNDPMEAILSLDAVRYRRASLDVAACAEWLKRFAEGSLDKEDE